MKCLWILSRFALVAMAMLPKAYAEEGLTRILSYNVNMTIASRFAKTHISVEIENEKDCATVRTLTFQLPLNARVTELQMTTSPRECELNGVVKAEGQAQQEFQESASQGRPAALLEAYDTTNYGVQVSLPPLGRTVLEIGIEELLQRKRGRVDFQVPVYPGLAVDLLTFEMSVNEPSSGVSEFAFEFDYENVDTAVLDGLQIMSGDSNGSTASAYPEAFQVPGNTDFSPLPRLLRGFYDPGPLPADGLILPDDLGTCFVHLFNPGALLASTGSLPRNIVFVIDVSGSMGGQKLDDAKAAFAAIVQKLTNEDFFTIHTFSSDGVDNVFGPNQATPEARQDGRDFVLNLVANGGTNLEGAYVEGIRKVRSMQIASRSRESPYVPVVMVLTDGEATSGITNPQEISRRIRAANSDGIDARIYGLAFGAGADFNLLSGISLQNGGRAVRIFEGYGDATTQMENFYVGELGTVLMSDLNVTFDGTVMIDSQTQTHAPVFADGSEFVVRARILSSGGQPGNEDVEGVILGATTVANTVQGVKTWRTELMKWGEGDPVASTNRNECSQSFAHAKITELMLFRDAAITLGSEMDSYYELYSLQSGISTARVSGNDGGRRRQQGLDVVSLVEDEALQLALEAGVVWPGLTAMVTVEDESCADIFEDAQICYDGDGEGADRDDAEEEDSAVFTQSSGQNNAPGAAPGGGNGASSGYSAARDPSATFDSATGGGNTATSGYSAAGDQSPAFDSGSSSFSGVDSGPLPGAAIILVASVVGLLLSSFAGL